MHVDIHHRPLRIAGVPEHFNYPWRQRFKKRAAHQGLFEPIDYREYPGGSGAMAKALNNGETDVAILLTEGAVFDIAKGGKHKIVKVYVSSPIEWGIHVAHNSPFFSIDDIQGHRYAISRVGSGSHLMATVHAHKMGWSNTLKLVEIGNLQGASEALPAGHADIFFWEKTMTHALVESSAFRLLDVFPSPWPSFLVCATDHALAEVPDRIHLLLQQINQIVDDLQTSCDAARLIADEFALSLDASEKWLAKTQWNLNFELPTDMLEGVLTHLYQLDLGLIPGQTIANFCHSFECDV